MRNFLFFLISVARFFPQNLVPDSSFEKNRFLPMDYSSLGASLYWNSPTRGTPDLFCRCKDKKKARLSVVNVPSNAMGIQEPHSGNCYAGIFCVSHGYYREYLQTRLTSPMEAGKEYRITMYISLSDYSPLAVDKIGICLLNAPVKSDIYEDIRNIRPIYIPVNNSPGTDSEQWHEISIIYKASGGENTLLIGSFDIRKLYFTHRTPPPEVSTPVYKKEPRDAYYYFDDISIHTYVPDTLPESASPVAEESADSIPPEIIYVKPDTSYYSRKDTVLRFRNLLFASGRASIMPSSYPELDLLAERMKTDPSLLIEIYGHTDNTGDERKNRLLSEQRARAVAEYLRKKGVENYRILFVGYGSEKPVGDNQTEEGRRLNRRVEFLLRK